MSPEQKQNLLDALERMQADGINPLIASTAGLAAENLYDFVRAHGTAGVIALGLVVGLVTREGHPITDAFDHETTS